MTKLITLIVLSFFVLRTSAKDELVITSDIDNFWEAYDLIVATDSFPLKYKYINELYIDKASDGLKDLMELKNYTAKSYVEAINACPRFWNSVRANTLEAKKAGVKIQEGVDKLREIYPDLRPANVYFSIGVLKTPGTTRGKNVLIGAELAMADPTTVADEFSKRYAHLRPYFRTNPGKEIVFLNVHEYVHTQQKTTIGRRLIEQTMIEGVAEFVATIALGVESPNPQIALGREKDLQVRKAFEKEMYSPYFFNWLWNNSRNDFGMRDMAYYVGFAVCEKYYEKADDKNLAIKEMIELDYTNHWDLMDFVDRSEYFDFSLAFYKQQFENKRPRIINIVEFRNGSQNVDPNITSLTIEFSKPMNENYGDFAAGTKGEEKKMKISKGTAFASDFMAYNVTVEFEPNTQYQLVVTEEFCDTRDVALIPYVIEIKTGPGKE